MAEKAVGEEWFDTSRSWWLIDSGGTDVVGADWQAREWRPPRSFQSPVRRLGQSMNVGMRATRGRDLAQGQSVQPLSSPQSSMSEIDWMLR